MGSQAGSHGSLYRANLGMASLEQTTQERVRAPETKPQSFYNLVSEVTPHCFCCVLCVRSKPLVSVYTWKKGSFHKDVNSRGGDRWRPSQALPTICVHDSTACPKEDAVFLCSLAS